MVRIEGRDMSRSGFRNDLDGLARLRRQARHNTTMQFGGTTLYVDEVSAVVDFYRRAFGFDVRFFDEALGFAELETGG